MRNVTLTLDDELARWARVRAAEEDKSLSRLLADLLRERMLEERQYRSAMKEYLAFPSVRLKRAGRYPRRDELHDRKNLR